MMYEFNWETFLNRNNHIAVHCKTEEEARKFCKQMHEHGLTWCSEKSYLDHIMWKDYGTQTCYDNTGCYCYLDYYQKGCGWIILEYSDFNANDVESVEEFLLRIGRKEMIL